MQMVFAICIFYVFLYIIIVIFGLNRGDSQENTVSEEYANYCKIGSFSMNSVAITRYAGWYSRRKVSE